MHRDGAEDLLVGIGQCLAGEAGAVPNRVSKILELFCSDSFSSRIPGQPCSCSSLILSLTTSRRQTEPGSLGLCLLWLAAFGNAAGIQHP